MQRMHDWRSAIKKPVGYAVANSSVRSQHRFVTIVLAAGAVVLIALYSLIPSSSYAGYNHSSTNNLFDAFHVERHHYHPNNHHLNFVTPSTSHQLSMGRSSEEDCEYRYNATYPLSEVVIDGDRKIMRIAVISDLDQESRTAPGANEWFSYLLSGRLEYNAVEETAAIHWDAEPVRLKSALSSGGRGMELSELVVFNGKLYTCDDRTGVVYEIHDSKPVPWLILGDGDGDHETKGFKCEWMAVRDRHLWVGGLGKEWTTPAGQVLNHNPQFVKRISPVGVVRHLDWEHEYNALRSRAGIESPGYLIHESAAWSDAHRQWFFLPRRASHEAYNDVDDEKRGTNLLMRAAADFEDIQVGHIGKVVPTHGFSSFKFVPGTRDSVIVALKSEENEGHIASYVIVFSLTGKVLLAESLIPTPNVKYEGIEFV